jgi:hypothetical protein
MIISITPNLSESDFNLTIAVSPIVLSVSVKAHVAQTMILLTYIAHYSTRVINYADKTKPLHSREMVPSSNLVLQPEMICVELRLCHLRRRLDQHILTLSTLRKRNDLPYRLRAQHNGHEPVPT